MRCPRCGSRDLVLVLKVPFSTDGIFSRGKIFFECRECGWRRYLKG